MIVVNLDVVMAMRKIGTGALAERYLGTAASAVYLIRPDQHVAARWESFDAAAVQDALRIACGKG